MSGLPKQTGVALAVTLFMLALLTIIGVSAVMLSSTHFRLVGNLQSANEVEMALRAAIEQVACEKSGADCTPAGYTCRSLLVCVNGQAIPVEIRPRCTGVANGDAEGGSISRNNVLDTYWDLEGKLKISNESGAKPTVHWGLMVPKGGPCPQPNPYLNTPPDCPTPAAVTCN